MDPSAAELDEELRRGLLPRDDEDSTTPTRRSSMGAVERLVLSPWEKWAAHGRFPYKLTLHVALVLLTFAQMQLYDAQNAAYMRASHRNWCVLQVVTPSRGWVDFDTTMNVLAQGVLLPATCRGHRRRVRRNA